MPRIRNTGENLLDWCLKTDSFPSVYDVCKGCFLHLEGDPEAFNGRLVPYKEGEPQGEDGWHCTNDNHPPYESALNPASEQWSTSDAFYCQVCGDILSSEDN